jgi:hypothetical protein
MNSRSLAWLSPRHPPGKPARTREARYSGPSRERERDEGRQGPAEEDEAESQPEKRPGQAQDDERQKRDEQAGKAERPPSGRKTAGTQGKSHPVKKRPAVPPRRNALPGVCPVIRKKNGMKEIQAKNSWSIPGKRRR